MSIENFLQSVDGDVELVLREAFVNPFHRAMVKHQIQFYKEAIANLSPADSDQNIALVFREFKNKLFVWEELDRTYHSLMAKFSTPVNQEQ